MGIGVAMRRRGLAAAVLAATALAVCGCGSSSKPLTRAELTAKADTICKSVSAKLATNKKISSIQDIARTAPKLASSEQSALNELSKLVPPAAMEADWKTFITGAQSLAENTAKLGEYAKSNNLKSARTLIVSSETTVKQMTAIAQKYGIKNCEQVP
jgi:hypothetical protein